MSKDELKRLVTLGDNSLRFQREYLKSDERRSYVHGEVVWFTFRN